MLVSVIINNYNYGRYLAEAINSTLNQAGSEVELIVVDDGSTDHSREIIRSFADRIIPVFKENGGQASALNAGFARSQGQVVIVLDADDILLPTAAARAAAIFAAHPGIAKAQYRMSVVDGQGRPTGAVRPARQFPLQGGDLRRQELSFPFDLAWGGINAFSADVLRQIFPIPAERYGQAGADWYLSHAAALFGEVCALDEVLAHYRIHGGNQYARPSAALDLAYLRQSIRYGAVTSEVLAAFADRLHLTRPKVILSVSDVASRLTSLRLSAAHHPRPADTRFGLLSLGLSAASRRFDIRWPMKAMFMAWFAAMALAPQPMARALAEAFFVPEKRQALSGLLARWRVRAAA